MAKVARKVLVIGIGGHAMALDPTTGAEIWRTKLKGNPFVTVAVSDGRVFAATSGEVFCLDIGTGEVLWHNALKGLGIGVVSFASSHEVVVEAAVEAQRRAGAAT